MFRVGFLQKEKSGQILLRSIDITLNYFNAVFFPPNLAQLVFFRAVCPLRTVTGIITFLSLA